MDYRALVEDEHFALLAFYAQVVNQCSVGRACELRLLLDAIATFPETPDAERHKAVDAGIVLLSFRIGVCHEPRTIESSYHLEGPGLRADEAHNEGLRR